MLTQTDRLYLRAWQDSDREPFAALNSDPKIMKFLGPPLTRQGSDAAINAQIALMKAGGPAFWAVENRNDGRFMGCIGFKAIGFKAGFTPGYEIGWRLARQYWVRGYATEGAKAALKSAFEQWGMGEIYSFTVHQNAASQSVMNKIGMTRIRGGDFNHPSLAPDDPLSAHVLYRIDRRDVMV